MTPAATSASPPSPDPKAQAEDILATVSAMIGASLEKLRVTSAAPGTRVWSAYPCTVITTETNPPYYTQQP